jgi:4-oxalocrotonate tautomerase
MPLINVVLEEGVFSTEQKHAMATKLTDVMVEFEGSEAFREAVWVLIEERRRDAWNMGGHPFAGPPPLMATLGRSKEAYEAVKENPTTRAELVAEGPVPTREGVLTKLLSGPSMAC